MEPDLPCSCLSFIFLSASPLAVAFNLIAIAILLLLSGLISGSEVAFFSLKAHDYKKLEKENSPAARRILAFSKRPRTLLATILISNNFINIAIVLISDRLVNNLLSEETFDRWGHALQKQLSFLNLTAAELARSTSFLLTVVLVTFLLVLFGEVAPKIYANMNRLSFALRMSGPLSFLMKLFAPLSKLLVNGTGLIEKRLKNKYFSREPVASKEDINKAITLAVHADKDISPEMDILKRITTFSEVPVRRIMRSRMDIVAIEKNADFETLLETIRNSGYSRLPVYEEDLDHITGLIYAKDLLGSLHKGAKFKWQRLIKTGQDNPIIVPETKKINDMLRVFQSKHKHLAIVVNEYGGTIGLVTLEDILEEIVGEIRDEFDKKEKPHFEKKGPCTYIFEAKTPLHDFFRELKINESNFDKRAEDVETLAGLVLEIAGEFPQKGQDILTEDQKYIFTVTDRDERRIKKVKVVINNPAGDSSAEAENNMPCDTP